MAEPAIRYTDRLFLTGATSSGKSTLARRLHLAMAGPRLVIDPANSELTEVPGAVTFSDPTRATNSAGVSWRDAEHARFVPRDPYDLDTYSQLYDWCFEHAVAGQPRTIWCDEAGYVFPSSGGNRGGRRVIAQGRKFGLGHSACHTRPRWVSADLIANAAHVFVFVTPSAQDRQHLADSMGVDRPTFERAHAELEPYGYLWWQQRQRELMICGPQPAP